jgi:hypothetical protein
MIRWLTSRPFQYRAHTYHWRTDGERWDLVTAGRVVAKVVPDEKYARMWRIDLGDGILSDMVNLPRAKDAAMRRVDAMLDATKPAVRGSPMRQNGLAVPSSLESLRTPWSPRLRQNSASKGTWPLSRCRQTPDALPRATGQQNYSHTSRRPYRPPPGQSRHGNHRDQPVGDGHVPERLPGDRRVDQRAGCQRFGPGAAADRADLLLRNSRILVVQISAIK